MPEAFDISKFTRAIVEDKENSTIFDTIVAIEILYLLLYVTLSFLIPPLKY